MNRNKDYKIFETQKRMIYFLVAFSLFFKYASADFGDTLPSSLPSKNAQPSPTPSPSTTPEAAPVTKEVQAPSPKNSDADEQSAAKPSEKSENKAGNSGQATSGLMSPDVTEHNNDAPIHVQGDLVKGMRSEGKLILEGNVKLTQADAELLANQATVFSDPGTTKTKRAVAVGDVKFSKKSTIAAPPLRAEADELEYFVPERRIRLTGKPKVWRGNELIQGKEIFVELDTGAVTIKEARGVVEPAAQPKGSSQKNKP